jgi:two-component system sensor histidine kinase UhpB
VARAGRRATIPTMTVRAVTAGVAGASEPAPSNRAARTPIPLFWRLFVPNAGVLVAACALLIFVPPNGRAAILLSGLALMLVTDLVLMRWAFAPLERLFALMRQVDPLVPGRRLAVGGPESEVTELTRAFNDMMDRLEFERRDSARRALAAQEAERRRVAHELHDEVGQSLTAVVLELDRVARAAPDGLRGEIEYSKQTAADSLDDIRRIARRLRPEALDDLGLASALTSLADRISQAGSVTVHRRFEPGLPRLDSEIELVVYRIAQESLTNALRHAGASSVELALRGGGSRVRLTVTDDGCGFDPTGHESGNGGIRGMRERALLIGARLAVESVPGQGTTLVLDAPAERERA